MPLYFPGFPSSPLNSVQFNDGGRFGGNADLVFNKTTQILGLGDSLTLDGSYTLLFDLRRDVTPGASTYFNTTSFYTGLTPSAPPDGYESYDFVTESLGAQDNPYVQNMNVRASHKGSGLIAEQYGQYCQSDARASGNITSNYALYAIAGRQASTGAIASNYSVYADSLNLDTTTNHFHFYGKELDTSGVLGSAYYLWFDAQGVYRIRSDNTFNSVYQAIPALYNPQFTKYTPGAANYERIVFQWNSNIAEIGTEAGGTGTLRAVKIIGASLQAASYKSNDGSAGVSAGPFTAITSITVKNGIVTALTGT